MCTHPAMADRNRDEDGILNRSRMPDEVERCYFLQRSWIGGHRAACNRIDEGLIVVRVSEDRTESHYQHRNSTYL